MVAIVRRNEYYNIKVHQVLHKPECSNSGSLLGLCLKESVWSLGARDMAEEYVPRERGGGGGNFKFTNCFEKYPHLHTVAIVLHFCGPVYTTRRYKKTPC